MNDINYATFVREASRCIPDETKRVQLCAKFMALDTPEKRLDAFRELRGGSVTGKVATKLGTVPHTA